jgi:hypothetical protein
MHEWENLIYFYSSSSIIIIITNNNNVIYFFVTNALLIYNMRPVSFSTFENEEIREIFVLCFEVLFFSYPKIQTKKII